MPHLLWLRIQQALHIRWQSNNEGVCTHTVSAVRRDSSCDAFQEGTSISVTQTGRLTEVSFSHVEQLDSFVRDNGFK